MEFPDEVREIRVDKRAPKFTETLDSTGEFSDFFHQTDLVKYSEGNLSLWDREDMICVHETFHSYLEEIALHLMLVKPSKVESQLSNTMWFLEESALGLYRENARYNFLTPAFKKFTNSETTFCSFSHNHNDSAYIDNERKPVAVKRIVKNRSFYRKSIYISRIHLANFVKSRKLKLISCLSSFRYSERSLDELGYSKDYRSIIDSDTYLHDLEFKDGKQWTHDDRPLTKSSSYFASKTNLTPQLID